MFRMIDWPYLLFPIQRSLCAVYTSPLLLSPDQAYDSYIPPSPTLIQSLYLTLFTSFEPGRTQDLERPESLTPAWSCGQTSQKGGVPKRSSCSMPKGSKKPSSTPARSRARLQFLTIPLEIREHIYNDLLDVMPSTLFDLLLTNRQITREAKPFLYRQPLIFDGQSEFVDWLRNADRTYLRHVVEIHFKLHDIDPAKIVGALGKRLRQAPAARDCDDNPYEEACNQEIARLGNCFKYLPNVKSFTILPYSRNDARPPCEMLEAFADMLGDQLPNLRSLTYYEELLSITFLSSFEKLRHLRFPGVSTSSRAEVVETFRSLPELCRLEIWRPDFNIEDKHYQDLSGESDAGRCNIADIVGCLPHLKALNFREYALSTRPSPVFNPIRKTVFETLNALQRLPRLQELEILTNIDLLSRVQERFEDFISSSRSLRYVESYYDDMPAFEDLAPTIETLVMRLDPASELRPALLTDILSGVGESRAKLPRLREILLYLDSFPDSERTRNIATWVREKLQRMGIALRLKLWDGPSRF